MKLRALLCWLAGALPCFAGVADYFAINVLDDRTERGIPLVEFETINHLRFTTDSAGFAAINEPDLLRQKVYFLLHAPGYEVPLDAAGLPGVAIEVRAGTTATIKLRRLNIAERLYRLTGAGIYRDSLLLERHPPLAEPLLNADVVGQDSMMAAAFRGHIFWFGGDTLRLGHPLGQYRTSGAISDEPGVLGLDPSEGVDLRYLVEPDGFVRPIWPKPAEGAIWTDGVMVLEDPKAGETMLAHYAQMKSATEMMSHGVGIFDRERNQFTVLKEFPATAGWRHPCGQTLKGTGPDEGYFLFPAPEADLSPFPAVRVKAALEAVQNPEAYEAFTYLKPGSETVERNAAGRVVYGWKPNSHPVGRKQERELIATHALSEEEGLTEMRDLETRTPLEFHAGSVQWNEYRKKWIMIGEQLGTASFSGEIWYAEADTPVGPWRTARRIATHGAQSFYNPVHHPFFDQKKGRLIYFEGSYSNTGAANAGQTARYDFNQLMYRLDLADPRLRAK